MKLSKSKIYLLSLSLLVIIFTGCGKKEIVPTSWLDERELIIVHQEQTNISISFNPPNWRTHYPQYWEAYLISEPEITYPVLNLPAPIKQIAETDLLSLDYLNQTDEPLPAIFWLLTNGEVYFSLVDPDSIVKLESLKPQKLPLTSAITSLKTVISSEGMGDKREIIGKNANNQEIDLVVVAEFRNLSDGPWINYFESFHIGQMFAVWYFESDQQVTYELGNFDQSIYFKYTGTYELISEIGRESRVRTLILDLSLKDMPDNELIETTINGRYFADMFDLIYLELFAQAETDEYELWPIKNEPLPDFNFYLAEYPW